MTIYNMILKVCGCVQGRNYKKKFGWGKFFPSPNIIAIVNINLNENFINA